ncbi:hypothetical protein SAMN05421805_10675 [Saccharopolyspora antimicrobica]|uniref:Uncharacterized protein n=1 Tax=Saccharopolyspora antimicrobica TaxID=455193 RepID=A0A1I5B196_9PSEU|nr:hypothetical protein [Saccharopolyspora antimicrobica]RKT86434.1 hypothetical protein ATL45_4803 [Saccharopolyspora antimicrobica]SFN68391.1 hypothetical protein SAMN05421805_10675 [Saccharopolyspora antimicrobica]
MSALPIPEAPPPDTPDDYGPNPCVGSVREPRREPIGLPVPTTVRLCLLDPAAGADEIIAAAVSMIITTYTVPGDRIMLTDAGAAMADSRERRDRLVESALRLGRSAATMPDHRSHSEHHPAPTSRGLHDTSKSGSGLGPRCDDTAGPVANPTGQQSLGEASSPDSDGFRLVIAGWSDHPVDPFAKVDWARVLAPAGAIVVLTHGSDQRHARATHSGQWARAAAAAGLILTDRLILAHQLPAAPRSATPLGRQAIALHGHRRIHTTACVFHRSTPPAEADHA